MTDPAPSFRTLLARGLRRRCPRCGEGRLFKRFNVMHERCAVCGLQYLENQGDLLGYLVVLDRALFIFPLVAMLFLRLYVPSSRWFYVACVLSVLGLVFTLPQRTGVSVALDYLLRRQRSGE